MSGPVLRSVLDQRTLAVAIDPGKVEQRVWLADRLIELALGIELERLPGDELEDAAHASARRAAGV